ncbi:MAG: hypothetical protein U0324_02780 [Polyangiales bacterium]
MLHRSLAALAFALTSLAFAPAVRAQPAPWGDTAVTASHTVPPPPPPARRVVDLERAPGYGAPPVALPEETGPQAISPGRRVGQITGGYFAGAGGALGAALLAAPAFKADEDGLGYAIIYAGWAAVTSATVWGIGRGGRADGSLLATLLGAGAGAVAGAGVQFWLKRDGDREPGFVLLSGALITAGAVVGYGLSASSAEEIAAEREHGPEVAPTLAASRDGLLVGASGSF